MLITILERDTALFEKLPFKLRRPYLALVDKALSAIRADLKATDIYLVRRNMRLVADVPGDEFTNYTFISAGYEEHKRYTAVQLRTRAEEMLGTYLIK